MRNKLINQSEIIIIFVQKIFPQFLSDEEERSRRSSAEEEAIK
jgi:hypothetical protein